MHYALAPYVGTGTSLDPFRPRGSEQPGWAAIDLRPDATRLDGYALVKTPARIRGAVDLGEDATERWSFRPLASRLGVTLERGTLGQQAARLLLREWGGLRPESQGPFTPVYRIWLGGLIWSMPALAGGVSFAETFPTDGNLAGTQDQVWTEVAGTGFTVTTGAAQISGNVGNCVARCDTTLATNDMIATVTLVSATWVIGTLTGEVICRKSSDATLTFYHFQVVQSGTTTSSHALLKTVAGSESSLGTNVADIANGETLGVEANGTSIRGIMNGSTLIGPVTDAAIDGTTVGGKFVGLRCFSGSAGNIVRLDTFSGADLVEPPGGATGIGSYWAQQYAGRR